MHKRFNPLEHFVMCAIETRIWQRGLYSEYLVDGYQLAINPKLSYRSSQLCFESVLGFS